MNIFTKIILLLILLINSQAYATMRDEFDQAMEAYKEQAKTASSSELLPFAQRLYEAGLEHYQKGSINIAVLAQNYAKILNLVRQPEKAIGLLQIAIEIYKREDKEQTIRLQSALMELGGSYRMSFNERKARLSFGEAIELAEVSGEEQLADIKLAVGILYLSYGATTKNEAKKSKRYFVSAYETFKKLNNKKEAEAAFWAGKASTLMKKPKQAIEYFNSVLRKSADSKSIHRLALTSHAFLVEAYSKTEQEKLATQHCQAIGKMQPWKGDVEPVHLYRLNPLYPRNAAKRGKEGWVKVNFIIDKNGFVKDISVAKNSGAESFVKAAMKVLPKWRFAPKFEDGKPVSTPVTYTMSFALRK